MQPKPLARIIVSCRACPSTCNPLKLLKKAHHGLCIVVNITKKGRRWRPWWMMLFQVSFSPYSTLMFIVPTNWLSARQPDWPRCYIRGQLIPKLSWKSYRKIWLRVWCFLFVCFQSSCFFQAQRVTDPLRDKLYNQSTLLLEYRDRIHELEEEKHRSPAELL